MQKGLRKKFIALALLLFLLPGVIPVRAEGDYAAELAAAGFPESYHAALTALHEKYPQWSFEAFTPAVSWSEALRRETAPRAIPGVRETNKSERGLPSGKQR